ncbi:MAG: hypothetical protein EOP06_23790 [Proteobacteria bacterium]|nr:MAG: hypothetical protein EOP06_23790 [Pseudomonadota bacterium]
MITLSALLAFAGFYSAYQTSGKAVLVGNSPVNAALRNNASEARRAAIALFLLSLSIAILSSGIGVGTLLFFVFAMLSGSVIVLLAPLKVLTWQAALLVFAIFAAVELLQYI